MDTQSRSLVLDLSDLMELITAKGSFAPLPLIHSVSYILYGMKF